MGHGGHWATGWRDVVPRPLRVEPGPRCWTSGAPGSRPTHPRQPEAGLGRRPSGRDWGWAQEGNLGQHLGLLQSPAQRPRGQEEGGRGPGDSLSASSGGQAPAGTELAGGAQREDRERSGSRRCRSALWPEPGQCTLHEGTLGLALEGTVQSGRVLRPAPPWQGQDLVGRVHLCPKCATPGPQAFHPGHLLPLLPVLATSYPLLPWVPTLGHLHSQLLSQPWGWAGALEVRGHASVPSGQGSLPSPDHTDDVTRGLLSC